MKIMIIITLLVICILSSCANISNEVYNTDITLSPTMNASPDIENIDWEEYSIVSLHYSKSDVQIDYPYITDLVDIEKQNKINELLILAALDWAKWWLDDDSSRMPEESFDEPFNVMLDIEYDILFQSDKYLCVNYSGFYFTNRSAHPIHLFYTVNIDMSTGNRLALSDIVNVDDALVNTLMDYFRLYIDDNVQNTVAFSNELMQYPESAFLLEQVLEERGEDGFLRYLTNANSNDDFFYFTEDVFGFSFEIQYFAGDHYEIEIQREDIEQHLILKDLFD